MKNQSIADFYNNLYQEKENLFGKEINLLTKKLLENLHKGVIADIGAGEGTNAIFLAKKGFTVEAYDISTVAINRLNANAKSKNLPMHTNVVDASTIVFKKKYEAILAYFLLHHLFDADARALIQRMKDNTSTYGYNAVATFTKDSAFFRSDPSVKDFYPTSGELKTIYQDWDILFYEEKQTQASILSDTGEPLFNTAAMLLARKP